MRIISATPWNFKEVSLMARYGAVSLQMGIGDWLGFFPDIAIPGCLDFAHRS
jgi:hypothetical protein